MNEHSFISDIDEDKGDEDDDNVPFQTESKLCIMDLSKYGWEDIDKVNVIEVRKTAKKRYDCQRDVTKYITMNVIGMKKKSERLIPRVTKYNNTPVAILIQEFRDHR